MPDSSVDRDPLDRLAEEFVDRYRAGERPSLTEFADRLPDRADEVRELFPALVEMEQLKATLPDPIPSYPGDGRPMPERVGEFRILRRIGVGGMGVVYEAVQESLGRRVALKLLPLEAVADPKRLERFRREAKAAARLHHTNIVPVFGTGEADGRHFYAMQFISGHSLDAVIDELKRLKEGSTTTRPATGVANAIVTGTFARSPSTNGKRSGSTPDEDQSGTQKFAAPPVAPQPDGPLLLSDNGPVSSPSLTDGGRAYWTTVARLGAQVADALSYAHAQGVLHRDIKPANLLLDLRGTVWVADFGLAKSNDADDLTHAGDIIGTIRYMAPERFEGTGDHRADVYALGLSLYELLTLRPAFEAPTRAKLVEQVLAANPIKPRHINPAIPRDLETIVLKAITRDPAGRYQSTAEMADDLRRFLDDRSILARRATPAERVWRWCRRNPAVAGLISAVLIVSTAGAVVATGFALHAEEQRAMAERREKEGREKLLQSLIAEARAGKNSRRVGQRFNTLNTIWQATQLARELERPTETFDELRNLAASALALPDVRLIGEFDDPGKVWSIDAVRRQVAYQHADGSGRILRWTDGVEVRITSSESALELATFSLDGRELFASEKVGRLKSWNLDTGEERVFEGELAQSGGGAISDGLRFSRYGGRMLLTRCIEGVGTWVSVYDTSTLRRLFHRLFPSNDYYKGYWAVALSPDGTRLATTDGGYGDPARRAVKVVEVESGRVEREFPLDDSAFCPEWVDDATLAVGLWNRCIVRVYSIITGASLREFRDLGSGEPMSMASWSGQVLAVCSNWSLGQNLWNPHTGEIILRGGPRMNASLPDGRLVAWEFVGGKCRIWVLEPSPVFRKLAPHPDGYRVTENRDMDTHPDGRLIALGTNVGVTVIDQPTGQRVAVLPIGLIHGVRFHPTEGDLFTSSFHGLFRWPVRQAGRSVTFGPPLLIQQSFGGLHKFNFLSGGQQLVAAHFNHLRRSGVSGDPARLPFYYGPMNDVRWCKSNPDGRLIRGEQHANGVHFTFDAVTGRPSESGPADWAYEPTHPYTYRVENIHLLKVLSADGQQEMVTLEHPDLTGYKWAHPCPDPGRVLLVSTEDSVVVEWDLRQLRKHLAAIGLDWDAPPLPPGPPAGRFDIPPLTGRVIDGHLATNATARAAANREADVLTLLHNPFDASAHYRLGVQARVAGRYAQALNHLNLALLVRPDHEGALSHRALVSQIQGRHEQAVADATKALAGGSNDPATRMIRARSLMSLGRFSEAVADLSAVHTIYPNGWEALELRAACYAALRDEKAAIADRAAAASILATATSTQLNNTAWRLVHGPPDARDPKRALELIQLAVSRDPNISTYLNTLGVVQYRNGLFKEAVRTLEKNLATSRGASDAFDLYFLAMCHHRLGDHGKAKEYFDMAVSWDREKRSSLSPHDTVELSEFRDEAAELLGIK